jgi:hypothetical protein
MWNLVFGSVQGTSHQRTGKRCQDYCTGQSIATPSGVVLVAACADGAGSAEHSDAGARIACEAFVRQACITLGEGALDGVPGRDVVLNWNEQSREEIRSEAHTRNLPIRELACTLITAIVGESWGVFTQIGDGAIVFDFDGGYTFGFWPDRGEYANTTRFLTDSEWTEHIRFDQFDRIVMDLAILTDGLQMLALDFSEGRVHEPFFRPIFRLLRESEERDGLQARLLAFLDSKRVNERTDDDKSLFLATRRPPPNYVQSADVS